MESELVRLISSRTDVPIRELGTLVSPQQVPVYATTSRLLLNAYNYLITNNPTKTDGTRDERILLLAGSKEHEIIKLEIIYYPLLKEQDKVHVKANKDDVSQLLIELSQRGHVFYGTIHNHPGKGYQAANPSPIDIGKHSEFEEAYKHQFLTVILTEDGSISFWQPRNFEIFINGRQLTTTIGPHLNKYLKLHHIANL